MAKNYIPRSDAGFALWLAVFADGCSAQHAALGLTVAEAAALSAAVADLTSARAAHEDAQAAATSACVAKDASRASSEKLARALSRKIQANAAVTNDLKAGVGLPVHDTTLTRASRPTTFPQLQADNGMPLQHTLIYHDEATPNSRAKPRGVREIEIWGKIGAPAPIGPSDCQLLGTSGKNRLRITHRGADAGKPVYYIARWKNAHGECGPFGNTVIATIVG